MTDTDPGALQFRLPARGQDEQVKFAEDPKKLQLWLQEQPRANISEYARQYYLLLRHLNHAQLPDHRRLAIMESLLTTGDFVHNALKPLYTGAPLPLDQKKLSLALLGRQIAIELLTGYRIIAADRSAGVQSHIDRHQFHLVLHRCMEYFGIVLLRSYLIYTRQPEHIWREIHNLYRYAEYHRLHLGELTDTGSSIEEQYKRIVLLDLAGPNGLRQSDLERIHHNLLAWSMTATIRELRDPRELHSHFCLNLASEQPPGGCDHSPDQDEKNLRNFRIIDTREMIQHILRTERVTDSTRVRLDPGHRYMLSHSVLKQLLVVWNGQAHRHFGRTPDQRPLQMAVGMTACHQLLMQEDNPDTPLTAAAPDTGAVFDSRSRYKTQKIDVKSVDVWNPIYTIHSDRQDYELDMQLSAGSRRGKTSVHDATTADVSADGMRLVWTTEADGGTRPGLQIGEIVLIRESEDDRVHQWSICITRWLKEDGPDRLEIGLQRLSPLGIPVGIRLLKKGKETGDYHRALLLPEIRALDQQESVIFPAIMDSVGKMRLFIQGKTVTITPTTKIESTSQYHHYQFEYSRTDKRQLPEDDILREALPRRLRTPGQS